MTTEEDESLEFHEMGLDDRLLQGVAKLGWKSPTLIQEKSIPLILEGKDVLAKGRTGSGKTAAFALPLLQKILEFKRHSREQSLYALILSPSRELSKQIYTNIGELSAFCGRVIRSVDLSDNQIPLSAQRSLLVDLPDIVIGTPSRIAAHLMAGNLILNNSLEVLVIDEADLIFSFGYEKDIKIILGKMPSIFQGILLSATLTDDVLSLKKTLLHNPVILKLEEPSLPDLLTQYQIKVEEEDKFVLIYALFKLKLIMGKTLIFVNTVDRAYKMKLYLEQFSIPVVVLNSELPSNCRSHVVSQFNLGVYDVLVASDEKFLEESQESHRNKDKESGVSRGIDFQFVSNVINFDFPPDVQSYIHRVGRTARGNNKGTALSLIASKEMDRLSDLEEILQKNCSCEFLPFRFNMEELDGFRYRARDAWRSVTRIAIREARLKEIKRELLTSTALRSHFEDNPRDANGLRHDKALHTVPHKAHLKNVPDYIVPPTLKKMGLSGNNGRKGVYNFALRKGSTSIAKTKYIRRQLDPLLSLQKRRKKT